MAMPVTLQCPGLEISATAAELPLARRICEVADKALSHMGACHLRQNRPFRIVAGPDLRVELDGCLGAYYCSEDLVEVLEPGALSEAVKATGLFADMPLPVLFDSLVTHEIAHVLDDHSSAGPPTTHEEVEYIAYAMQLDLLPADARAALVKKHPVTRPVSIAALNPIVLAFRPEVFAVKAWLHFRARGNGCGFIDRVLRREIRFRSDYP